MNNKDYAFVLCFALGVFILIGFFGTGNSEGLAFLVFNQSGLDTDAMNGIIRILMFVLGAILLLMILKPFFIKK